MEGCTDHNTLEHIYESRYHGDIACGKVDRELDEDDMEELWNLAFNEMEGEWDIKHGFVINAPHLIHLKL